MAVDTRRGKRNGNGRRDGEDAQDASRDPAGAGNGAAPGRPDAQSAPRDALLSQAAHGPLQRWTPGASGIKAAVKLAMRPQKVVTHGGALAAELAKIAVGRSEVGPAKGDRRFSDPAWTGNPAYRRLAQSYLATAGALDRILCAADLPWAEERRVRFAAENLVDALAPTNFPPMNPAVMKATLDTGGRNFVKGFGHFVADMRRSPRIPSMVDRSSFKVGENLAVSPGAVVLRTEVFELIQYEPQTDKVRERPLVVVPPMINKYYITDLAPGRSMIEFLVKGGHQVFAMSWRNPGREQADWNLDTYVGAVVEALEAAQRIAGCDDVNALGLCAGGITLATAAA